MKTFNDARRQLTLCQISPQTFSFGFVRFFMVNLGVWRKGLDHMLFRVYFLRADVMTRHLPQQI